MIEFLRQLFEFGFAATPWLAGFAGLAGLFSSAFRPGILVGLGCALLGGVIGAAACSGEGYNSGWGPVAMIVFWIEGACTGFLLGLGGYGV